MTDLLENLKKKEKELQDKLTKKRVELGLADSAMQSRFPSGRFELENYIALLEKQLLEVQEEIKGIEHGQT